MAELARRRRVYDDGARAAVPTGRGLSASRDTPLPSGPPKSSAPAELPRAAQPSAPDAGYDRGDAPAKPVPRDPDDPDELPDLVSGSEPSSDDEARPVRDRRRSTRLRRTRKERSDRPVASDFFDASSAAHTDTFPSPTGTIRPPGRRRKRRGKSRRAELVKYLDAFVKSATERHAAAMASVPLRTGRRRRRAPSDDLMPGPGSEAVVGQSSELTAPDAPPSTFAARPSGPRDAGRDDAEAARRKVPRMSRPEGAEASARVAATPVVVATDSPKRPLRVDALAAAPPAAVVKVEPSTPAERARMDVSVPEATGAAPSKSEVSGDPSSPAAPPSGPAAPLRLSPMDARKLLRIWQQNPSRRPPTKPPPPLEPLRRLFLTALDGYHGHGTMAEIMRYPPVARALGVVIVLRSGFDISAEAREAWHAKTGLSSHGGDALDAYEDRRLPYCMSLWSGSPCVDASRAKHYAALERGRTPEAARSIMVGMNEHYVRQAQHAVEAGIPICVYEFLTVALFAEDGALQAAMLAPHRARGDRVFQWVLDEAELGVEVPQGGHESRLFTFCVAPEVWMFCGEQCPHPRDAVLPPLFGHLNHRMPAALVPDECWVEVVDVDPEWRPAMEARLAPTCLGLATTAAGETVAVYALYGLLRTQTIRGESPDFGSGLYFDEQEGRYRRLTEWETAHLAHSYPPLSEFASRTQSVNAWAMRSAVAVALTVTEYVRPYVARDQRAFPPERAAAHLANLYARIRWSAKVLFHRWRQATTWGDFGGAVLSKLTVCPALALAALVMVSANLVLVAEDGRLPVIADQGTRAEAVTMLQWCARIELARSDLVACLAGEWDADGPRTSTLRVVVCYIDNPGTPPTGFHWAHPKQLDADSPVYLCAATAVRWSLQVTRQPVPTLLRREMALAGRRDPLLLAPPRPAPEADEQAHYVRLEMARCANAALRHRMREEPPLEGDPTYWTEFAERVPSSLNVLNLPDALRGHQPRGVCHRPLPPPRTPEKRKWVDRETNPDPGVRPSCLEDLFRPVAWRRYLQYCEAFNADMRRMRDGGDRKFGRELCLSQDDIAKPYRGVIWDCRDPNNIKPLDFGEPPSSHLNLEALGRLLEDWDDKELASHLLDGVRLRTDARLTQQVVLLPHMVDLAPAYGKVEKELKRLQGLGYYDFFRHPPFFPIRCNKNGAVVRKHEPNRPRRKTDGSAPRNLFDASGVEAVSLNAAIAVRHQYENGVFKWPKEAKPSPAQICQAVTVLGGAARALRCYLLMATDDLKDFFNQLRLAPQEWWKCCCQWPGLIDDPDASSFVAEYVLGFGLGCSSGIAQRFGDLLMATVRKRFDREEAQLAHERGGRRPEPDRGYNVAEFERRAAETQRLVGSGKPPTTLPDDHADAHDADLLDMPVIDAVAADREYQEWVDARTSIGDTHGSRLYYCDIYTDDPIFVGVGADRLVRLLRVWRRLTLELGLAVAIAAKRNAGSDVVWLGVHFYCPLECVAASREKICRALVTISRVLAYSDMTLKDGEARDLAVNHRDYQSLAGLLVHLLPYAYQDSAAISGLWNCLRRDAGPAEPITRRLVERGTLMAWVERLTARAGVPCADAFGAPASAVPAGMPLTFWTCTDAALDGAVTPGLAGFMHGAVWCLELEPEDYEATSPYRFAIPVLEFAAIAINLIMFQPIVGRATLAMQSDSLTSVDVIARARGQAYMMRVVMQELARTPEFIAQREQGLVSGHLYGEGNAFADLPSRGRWLEFYALCAQCGITVTRLPVSKEGLEFFARVRAAHRAFVDGDPVPLGPAERPDDEWLELSRAFVSRHSTAVTEPQPFEEGKDGPTGATPPGFSWPALTEGAGRRALLLYLLDREHDSSPVWLHATRVLDGVTPLGNSTLAGAATRCTGPRRGHTPGHLYARRCGYTLHWSSTGSHPWATLRSPVRLPAALVLDGVTPLGNSTLAGAATRCTGPRRGHTPGQLYARRCGYTPRRSSTGSHPWAPLCSPVWLHATRVLDGVTPLGNSTLAGAATRRAGSQWVTPWAPLRSPVWLHATRVLEGVTPLGDVSYGEPVRTLPERQAAFLSLDATALEVRYNPATEDSDAVKTVIDRILERERTETSRERPPPSAEDDNPTSMALAMPQRILEQDAYRRATARRQSRDRECEARGRPSVIRRILEGDAASRRTATARPEPVASRLGRYGQGAGRAALSTSYESDGSDPETLNDLRARGSAYTDPEVFLRSRRLDHLTDERRAIRDASEAQSLADAERTALRENRPLDALAGAIHPGLEFERGESTWFQGLRRTLRHTLETSGAESTREKDLSYWRHWEAFCERLGTTPRRFDRAANLGLHPGRHAREVVLALTFILEYYRHMRPRSFEDRPRALPTSARSAWDAVRRQHWREYGEEMVKPKALAALIKSMMRDYADIYGHEFLLQRRAEPITRDILMSLLAVPDGTELNAGTRYAFRVEKGSWTTIVKNALFTFMFETAVRKAEISLTKYTTPFARTKMSRWHVRFMIGGREYSDPSASELRSMTSGDHVIVTFGAAKNDPLSLIWGNRCAYLPFVGSNPLCAAKWMVQMELAGPIRGEDARRDAPLFTLDRNGRQGVFHGWVEDTLRTSLRTFLPKEEARRISPHSFRVGLASALLAAGVSFPIIKALCRWRDDESVAVYARMNPSTYAGHLASAHRGASAAAARQAANLPHNFSEGHLLHGLAED